MSTLEVPDGGTGYSGIRESEVPSDNTGRVTEQKSVRLDARESRQASAHPGSGS